MATARPEAARPKRRRRAFATAGLQARQSAPKPGNGRLSRGDWIAASQAVLCEVGIAGLRVSVLTRRLRVSAGQLLSPLHRDGGLSRRIGEPLQPGRCAADPRARHGRCHRAALAHSPTGGNLVRQHHLPSRPRHARLATSDPRAAASIKASKRLVLAFLVDAFAELGFVREDAALRAHLLLSANVALIGDFRLSGDCELFKGASSSYRAMRQPLSAQER
jgi:hypothetical protein